MNEDRATAGSEHLQTAALEVISAMRAFLDVAEEVVTHDDRIEEFSRIVGSVAQGVSNATGFPVPGARPAGGPAPSPTASPSSGVADGAGNADPSPPPSSDAPTGPDADLRPSGVQHIRVS